MKVKVGSFLLIRSLLDDFPYCAVSIAVVAKIMHVTAGSQEPRVMKHCFAFQAVSLISLKN